MEGLRAVLSSALSPLRETSVWRLGRQVVAEFADKKCQRSAAALTYMTLFALVPMMMVMYSMFSVIPAFEGVGGQLQSLIFSNFVPETGSEVAKYLTKFSQQARTLTLPGVAILVVTAYLMLTNIEKTFNTIWGVKEARRGLSSFLLYWAVLSIGPLLLGAGLVMSTYLVSLQLMVGEVNVLSSGSSLFRIVPIAMGSVAFTLLFAAVPNCRVPLKDAFIGGVITAVCFEMAKVGFAAFVANSSFQFIYGAFAAVPLFLLWINFIWMIVLAGAVLVRTLAEKEYARGARRHPDMVAILLCLQIFRRKSLVGEEVSDADCVKAGVGLVHWQSLRSELVRQHWIAVTDSGRYVLARDLSSVTLWDVAQLVALPVTLLLEEGSVQAEWYDHIRGLQTGINHQAQEVLAQRVTDFFDQKAGDFELETRDTSDDGENKAE